MPYTDISPAVDVYVQQLLNAGHSLESVVAKIITEIGIQKDFAVRKAGDVFMGDFKYVHDLMAPSVENDIATYPEDKDVLEFLTTTSDHEKFSKEYAEFMIGRVKVYRECDLNAATCSAADIFYATPPRKEEAK